MKYYRKFITLSMDGDKYSKAFGSVVLEHRDNIGKINVSLQGLRENTFFIVQLVKVEATSVGVTVGEITTNDKGNGNLRLELNPYNVSGSGYSLDSFDVVIIRIGNTKDLITPLVGYVDNIVFWKNNFKNFIKNNGDLKINDQIKIKQENVEEKTKENIKVESNLENKPISENKLKQCDIFFNSLYSKEEKTVIENKQGSGTKINDILRDEEIDFSSMVKKLQKEFEEIKLLTEDVDNIKYDEEREALEDDNDIVSEAYKNVPDEAIVNKTVTNKTDTEEITIENVMTNYAKIVPFEKSDNSVSWVLIGLEELALLKGDCYLFIRNPIFRTAKFLFGNLILGKYVNEEKYIIGVPDHYSKSNTDYMRRNGFLKFMSSKNKELEQGDLGYWLMPVKET